jgi:hypothetical protein
MQAGSAPVGGKICRGGHELPGMGNLTDCEKARFYWVFRNGMAFAEELA